MDQIIGNKRGEMLRGNWRIEGVSGYASQAMTGIERAGGTLFRVNLSELKYRAPA